MNFPNPDGNFSTGVGGACPQGSYCPEGTSRPLSCPWGTYSDRLGQHKHTFKPFSLSISDLKVPLVLPQSSSDRRRWLHSLPGWSLLRRCGPHSSIRTVPGRVLLSGWRQRNHRWKQGTLLVFHFTYLHLHESILGARHGIFDWFIFEQPQSRSNSSLIII